jgi:predicted RNA methylase
MSDAAFDQFLPPELRHVSDDYWTPLPVVRRVAAWLRAERIGTLVDIGSGAGKFCVTTALLAPCRVIGLEQRPSLVASAEALASLFEVDDRVRFVTGAFGDVPTPLGDAYYLFNPFGEYAFSPLQDADDAVTFSEQGYTRDVDATTRFLARARPGTVVITYNGFGADPPPSYEQTRVDLGFRGALRLWKKRRQPTRARTSFRLHLPEIEPIDDEAR